MGPILSIFEDNGKLVNYSDVSWMELECDFIKGISNCLYWRQLKAHDADWSIYDSEFETVGYALKVLA